MSRLQIAEQVYETVLIEIDCKLRQQIVPAFWKHFQDTEETTAGSSNNERGFYQLQVAVYELHQNYGSFQNIINRLKMFKQMCRFENSRNKNQDESEVFNEMLKTALLSQLPVNFNNIIYSFYSISFKVFANTHLNNQQDGKLHDFILSFLMILIRLEDDAPLDKCNGCTKESNNCRCKDLVSAFYKTNKYLTHMNLLDRLAGYTLTTLIQERIATNVQDTCKGIFDQSHIKTLEKWLDTVVLNWLIRIYSKEDAGTPESVNSETSNVVKDFKIKLCYYLYETYANTIIEQFFNIIIGN